jgi:3-oxoacyl-[acyl-carrier-protein] synthase II
MPTRSRNAAVITGLGAVCAAGWGADALEAALLDGVPRIGPVPDFDASRTTSALAARVPAQGRERRDPRGRAWGFLLHASLEALESSGLGREGFARPSSRVVMGTTLGGMDILKDLMRDGDDPRSAFVLPYHAGADALADLLSAGDASTLSGACASALLAVGHGARLVEAGRARCVLAGGFDAHCEFVHAGFSSLLALDPEACRPFDRDRKGLVLGEGAGVVLIEAKEDALEAGRVPLAEILGFACFGDANHITGPHPDGDGLLRTLEAAWAQTDLDKDAIGAIHAHGTATLYNDRMEGIALKRFLGDRLASVPVTAAKGVIGHALGAAGGLETVASVAMLRAGFVPRAAGFSTPDPECVVVPATKTLHRPLEVVVKSAAGFGGQNAALVLGRTA